MNTINLADVEPVDDDFTVDLGEIDSPLVADVEIVGLDEIDGYVGPFRIDLTDARPLARVLDKGGPWKPCVVCRRRCYRRADESETSFALRQTCGGCKLRARRD